MFSDALQAFAHIFSSSLRKIMWKSHFLTGAVLIGLALCLDRLAASIMSLGPAWLTWLLSIAAVALGLLVGVVLLAPPTASQVAGFYLDHVAAIVERQIDPMGVLGPPAAGRRCAHQVVSECADMHR